MSGVHQIDIGSISVGVESEVTQQKSQHIPSLHAICWVPTDLCGVVGSQEAIRVRLAEILRPKQTNI